MDQCTWDDDYKAVTQKIRRQLLQLGHVSEDDYTAVLMQGQLAPSEWRASSPAWWGRGQGPHLLQRGLRVRMTRICDRNRIPYVHYAESYDHIPDPRPRRPSAGSGPGLTHVAMVHSETTSGILNDIQSVGKVVRDAGRTFIVDAMSSFGGVDIPVSDWGIDFLVSSANKCHPGSTRLSLHPVPPGQVCSPARARPALCPWTCWTSGRGWRRTASGASPPPTHVVLAFSKALDELEAEGASPARHRRYAENNRLLIEKMRAMGFAPYIDGSRQGPIITTFFYPAGVPLPVLRVLHLHQGAGLRPLPGQAHRCRYLPGGQHRRDSPEDIEKLASIIAGFLAAHKEEIA